MSNINIPGQFAFRIDSAEIGNGGCSSHGIWAFFVCFVVLFLFCFVYIFLGGGCFWFVSNFLNKENKICNLNINVNAFIYVFSNANYFFFIIRDIDHCSAIWFNAWRSVPRGWGPLHKPLWWNSSKVLTHNDVISVSAHVQLQRRLHHSNVLHNGRYKCYTQHWKCKRRGSSPRRNLHNRSVTGIFFLIMISRWNCRKLMVFISLSNKSCHI